MAALFCPAKTTPIPQRHDGDRQTREEGTLNPMPETRTSLNKKCPILPDTRTATSANTMESINRQGTVLNRS